MKSIKQATSGLASSLFLAAGLTRLAEKTDPMKQSAIRFNGPARAAEATDPCVFPCYFTPKPN
ncbi:MAG TPA: hypothetical protein VG936_16690 [Lacunisphaera sp.]|nr:hypothetical protein [Lacunisphaera sp.]